MRRLHPITAWESPTEILYGGSDALIDRYTVEQFAQRFRCGLTVMENGEHWLRTQEQTGFPAPLARTKRRG